jgi:hypothetical protein
VFGNALGNAAVRGIASYRAGKAKAEWASEQAAHDAQMMAQDDPSLIASSGAGSFLDRYPGALASNDGAPDPLQKYRQAMLDAGSLSNSNPDTDYYVDLASEIMACPKDGGAGGCYMVEPAMEIGMVSGHDATPAELAEARQFSSSNVAETYANNDPWFDTSNSYAALSHSLGLDNQQTESWQQDPVQKALAQGAANYQYALGYHATDSAPQGFRAGWIDSMRQSGMGQNSVGQVGIGIVDSYLHAPDAFFGGLKALPGILPSMYNSAQKNGVGGTLLNTWVGMLEAARSGYSKFAYSDNREVAGNAIFGVASTAATGGFWRTGGMAKGVPNLAAMEWKYVPRVVNDSFGGVVAKTPAEAAFLRNASATFGDKSVFTSATRFGNNIVIQRSDISMSIQNVRRMANGNSPYVRNAAGDWEKINLHHIGRQDGKVIEILSSHNAYNPHTGGPLHIPGPGGPVRNLDVGKYWQQRLQVAIDNGSVPESVLDQLGR